jgi:hypothetical protein
MLRPIDRVLCYKMFLNSKIDCEFSNIFTLSTRRRSRGHLLKNTHTNAAVIVLNFIILIVL